MNIKKVCVYPFCSVFKYYPENLLKKHLSRNNDYPKKKLYVYCVIGSPDQGNEPGKKEFCLHKKRQKVQMHGFVQFVA